MFSLHLEEMLEASPSEAIHCWMKAHDGDALAEKDDHVQVDSCGVSPEAALVCHAAGASLYFRCGEHTAPLHASFTS